MTTEWKPGDLCQVRRGKKWLDAEVLFTSGHDARVSFSDSARLLWVLLDDLRPRPAPRGKLPEPKDNSLRHADGTPITRPKGPPTTQAVAWIGSEQVLTAIASALKPVPKPTTARNADYLAHVRRHPCCSCGREEGVVAHHIAGGGVAAKCSDYFTAPLCVTCHNWWHARAELPSMASVRPLGVDASHAAMWEAAARCLAEWVADRESDRG